LKILGIDPGTTQSAFLGLRPEDKFGPIQIWEKGIIDNCQLLDKLRMPYSFSEIVVIEMIACYGMPVGKDIFETVKWIGRFQEASESTDKKVVLVYRKDIKLHLCNSARAKDSNIRQALIDRLGKPGTKKVPGMLYGIKKDIWSALAVSVFYVDTLYKKERRN